MRKIFVAVLTVLGTFGAALGIVFVIGLSLADQHETKAQTALYAAVDRMRAVSNVEDADALLTACRSAQWGTEIRCRMLDYPVTYRGHHIPASWFEVSHRLHGSDRGAFTITLHLERKPRLYIMSSSF